MESVCREQPLPHPKDEPGKAGKPMTSTIPNIPGLPIHRSCYCIWIERVMSNPAIKDDVVAGQKYCKDRREPMSHDDRGWNEGLKHLRLRHCGRGTTKSKGHVDCVFWKLSTGEEIPGVAAGLTVSISHRRSWDRYVEADPAAANKGVEASRWLLARTARLHPDAMAYENRASYRISTDKDLAAKQLDDTDRTCRVDVGLRRLRECHRVCSVRGRLTTGQAFAVRLFVQFVPGVGERPQT